MPHEQLGLSNDELLSTTRAVRKRLDFDRPVGMNVIKECLQLAVQAPSGSNAQGWQFVVVTDEDKRRQIGEYYRKSWATYEKLPMAVGKINMDTGDAQLTESQQRSASSAAFLGENMGRAPVMLIPCIGGRIDNENSASSIAQAGVMGSIMPAAWNFMLAARARGLGTSLTTMHLWHEREISELLGIPYEEVTQVALIPVAYTKGTDFKPAYRPPIETVMHVNKW